MSKHLTKEEQYKVYSYYVGTNFQLAIAYLSPLPASFRGKADRFSSFNIYETESGNIRWKDFGGGGEFSGDAIDFVIAMEPDIHALPSSKQFRAAMAFIKQTILTHRLLDKVDVLEQINKHNLSRKQRVNPIPKYDQDFQQFELKYWKIFYLDQSDLVRRRVHALRGIDWGNGLTHPSTSNDPAFIYDLSEHGDMSSWQAYRPLTKNKRHKWKSWNLGVVPFADYWLLPPTGDNLIFTSGKKDSAVAEKAMKKYSSGEESWSFGNPTAEGSYRSILPLQNELNSRFKNIYVLFDGDSAGIKAMNNMYELTGWKPLLLDYPIRTGKRLVNSNDKHTKDIAEIAENYYLRLVYELITKKVHES